MILIVFWELLLRVYLLVLEISLTEVVIDVLLPRMDLISVTYHINKQAIVPPPRS